MKALIIIFLVLLFAGFSCMVTGQVFYPEEDNIVSKIGSVLCTVGGLSLFCAATVIKD